MLVLLIKRFTYSQPGNNGRRAFLAVIQMNCSLGYNVLVTAKTCGVFAWGRNDSGQLGQGETDRRSRDFPVFVPLPVPKSNRFYVSKVATGRNFVVLCVETKSSFIFTWGAIPVVEEVASRHKDEFVSGEILPVCPT